MVDRRLSKDDPLPIVIDLSIDHIFVGTAGEESPEKEYFPFSHGYKDGFHWTYLHLFTENWDLNLQNRPVFIVEPTHTEKKIRKEIANAAFNEGKALYIAFIDKAQSFHIYTGRHSSLVVELSENSITTTPIKGTKRFSDTASVIPIQNRIGELTEKNLDILTFAIYRTIMDCPPEFHREFFENIFIFGQSTHKVDLNQILVKKLKNLTSDFKYIVINLIQPSKTPWCGWIGGSIVASLRSFDKWLTETDYWTGNYYEKYLKMGIDCEGTSLIYYYEDNL